MRSSGRRLPGSLTDAGFSPLRGREPINGPLRCSPSLDPQYCVLHVASVRRDIRDMASLSADELIERNRTLLALAAAERSYSRQLESYLRANRRAAAVNRPSLRRDYQAWEQHWSTAPRDPGSS
jgi:hypothetical protein